MKNHPGRAFAAIEHQQCRIRKAIDSAAGFGCVVLDARDPARYLEFGVPGFVDDARAENLYALKSPGFMVALTREYAAGGAPLLTVEQVAKANAGGGLNQVAISGFGDVAGSDEHGVLLALAEDFRFRVAGFRVKSLFAEFCRDSLRILAPAFGLEIREYAPEALRAASRAFETVPFVLSSRLSDRPFEETSMLMSLFFKYSHPRFGFTLAEQRVLRLAVNGLNDEEIAERLGVSAAVVKKRLRVIYEKVLEAPGPPAIPRNVAPDGLRGPEVRRRLIVYLRDHPEELAPYDVKQARASGAAG